MTLGQEHFLVHVSREQARYLWQKMRLHLPTVQEDKEDQEGRWPGKGYGVDPPFRHEMRNKALKDALRKAYLQSNLL